MDQHGIVSLDRILAHMSRMKVGILSISILISLQSCSLKVGDMHASLVIIIIGIISSLSMLSSSCNPQLYSLNP